MYCRLQLRLFGVGICNVTYGNSTMIMNMDVNSPNHYHHDRHFYL